MGGGTPWLDQPVMLHSSRKYKCSLDTDEQCLWQQGYWRFWYEADHRFALPTIAFFLVGIILFSMIYVLSMIYSRKSVWSAKSARVVAVNRYLGNRSFRIHALNWNSAPLGVLILGAIGAVFFFAMTLGPHPYYWPNTRELSYGNSPPIATRTGWMSLACMPFVFATSPKSNLITALTGVPHEKLQVFHRWISYAMYALALVHTFPFIVFHVWKGDMVKSWNTSVVYWTGVVTLLAQTYLTFASMSPIRNMCYEWFKFSHFLAALVFILFFFFHCDFRLSSWDYFIATAILYSLSWLHSQLRTYFSNGIPKADVTLTSNGFIRIAMPTKTTWKAGQHYFIRLLGVGVHSWTAHPFTACSLPERAHLYDVKTSELVFYIRPQGGFTSKLAKSAGAGCGLSTRVVLDGPYGGVEMAKLARAERLLFIAGGSGAGWLLPMIESFLRRLDNPSSQSEIEKSSRPSARVILATRDTTTQHWFMQAVGELLARYPTVQSSALLDLEVYFTGTDSIASDPDRPSAEPKNSMKDTISRHPESDSDDSDAQNPETSTSHHVRIHKSNGRPDVPAIIETEAQAGGRSVGVFACGPLSMQSDLSNAVAKQQLSIMKDASKDMYLHMEHFSWA